MYNMYWKMLCILYIMYAHMCMCVCVYIKIINIQSMGNVTLNNIQNSLYFVTSSSITYM